MMKRLFLSAVMIALLGSYSFAHAISWQQDQAGDQQMTQEGAGGEHHGQWGAEHEQRHLDMMTKKLNLNSDQQTKIKAIMDDQQKQMMSLRQDSSMSQQDRRAKMMEIHQNSSSQIRALLNDDHQKKFDDMQAKMKERMAKRGGRHGGDGAPPQEQDQQQ